MQSSSVGLCLTAAGQVTHDSLRDIQWVEETGIFTYMLGGLGPTRVPVTATLAVITQQQTKDTQWVGKLENAG